MATKTPAFHHGPQAVDQRAAPLLLREIRGFCSVKRQLQRRRQRRPGVGHLRSASKRTRPVDKEKPRAWICSDLGILIDFKGKHPPKRLRGICPHTLWPGFYCSVPLCCCFFLKGKKGTRYSAVVANLWLCSGRYRVLASKASPGRCKSPASLQQGRGERCLLNRPRTFQVMHFRVSWFGSGPSSQGPDCNTRTTVTSWSSNRILSKACAATERNQDTPTPRPSPKLVLTKNP